MLNKFEKSEFRDCNDPPVPFILIPVGEYNGVDLPDIIIDENYIIWLEVSNPERDCEVIT